MQTATVSRPAVLQEAAVSQEAAPRATAGSLRLTRRGRVVATATAALLATLVMGIAAGVAQASSHVLPRGPSVHGVAERNLARVMVSPGQSLWSVAQDADPDADPRAITQEIIQLNALVGTTIYPGEQLWVPRQ
jgi:LysM repeat protein